MSSHLYWGIGTPPQYHECLLLLGRQIRHLFTNKGVEIGQAASDSQRPDSFNLVAIGKEDGPQHGPGPDAPCCRMLQ
jgi:hypothetical protein